MAENVGSVEIKLLLDREDFDAELLQLAEMPAVEQNIRARLDVDTFRKDLEQSRGQIRVDIDRKLLNEQLQQSLADRTVTVRARLDRNSFNNEIYQLGNTAAAVSLKVDFDDRFDDRILQQRIKNATQDQNIRFYARAEFEDLSNKIRSLEKAFTLAVDDSELTRLNAHLSLKQQHWAETQADLKKPLRPTIDSSSVDYAATSLQKVGSTYAIESAHIQTPVVLTFDSSSLFSAQIQLASFKSELASLTSTSSTAINLLVTHLIDSSALDQTFIRAANVFEAKGKDVGESIAKRVSKSDVQIKSGPLSSIFRGVFESVGQKMTGGFSGNLTGLLEKAGRGAEQYVTSKAGKSAVILSQQMGYKNTREMRSELSGVVGVFDRFIDPSKSRRDMKKLEQATGKALVDFLVEGKSVQESLSHFFTGSGDGIGKIKDVAQRSAGGLLRQLSPVLRINKDIQIARASQKAETLAETLEISDRTIATMQQYNGVAFAIGGQHNMDGRGGEEIVKPMLQRVMPGAYVEGVSNKYRDSAKQTATGINNAIGAIMPGVTIEGLLKKTGLDSVVSPNVLKMVDTAMFSGATPEVIEAAARAKVLRQRGITTPIAAVGYSSGGSDAADFASITKRLGVETKAVGVGSPLSGLVNRPDANFTSIMGTNDQFYRGLFGSTTLKNKTLNSLEGEKRLDFQDLISAGNFVQKPLAGTQVIAGAGLAHKFSDYISEPKVQTILGKALPGTVQAGGDFTTKTRSREGTRALDFIDKEATAYKAVRSGDHLSTRSEQKHVAEIAIEKAFESTSEGQRSKSKAELEALYTTYKKTAKGAKGSIAAEATAIVKMLEDAIEAVEIMEDFNGARSPKITRAKDKARQSVGKFKNIHKANALGNQQAEYFDVYDRDKYQTEVKESLGRASVTSATAKENLGTKADSIIQKIAQEGPAAVTKNELEIVGIQTKIQARNKAIESLSSKALAPNANAGLAKAAAIEIDRHTQAISSYMEQLQEVERKISESKKLLSRSDRLNTKLNNDSAIPSGIADELISSQGSGKTRQGMQTPIDLWETEEEKQKRIAKERADRKLAQSQARREKVSESVERVKAIGGKVKNAVFNPDRNIDIDTDQLKAGAQAVGSAAYSGGLAVAKTIDRVGTGFKALAASDAGQALLNATTGTARAMGATSKAMYALASGVESVVLDMIPVGRSAKGILKQTAVPALAYSAVTHLLPSGGAIAGGLEHLATGLLSPVMHGGGTALSGQASSIISQVVPNVMGMQSSVMSAATGLIEGAMNGAIAPIASAATAIFGGKLITGSAGNAVKALPFVAVQPQQNAPALPSAKPIAALPTSAVEVTPAQTPLTALTQKQLYAVARQEGIQGVSSKTKKDEIIASIQRLVPAEKVESIVQNIDSTFDRKGNPIGGYDKAKEAEILKRIKAQEKELNKRIATAKKLKGQARINAIEALEWDARNFVDQLNQLQSNVLSGPTSGAIGSMRGRVESSIRYKPETVEARDNRIAAVNRSKAGPTYGASYAEMVEQGRRQTPQTIDITPTRLARVAPARGEGLIESAKRKFMGLLSDPTAQSLAATGASMVAGPIGDGIHPIAGTVARLGASNAVRVAALERPRGSGLIDQARNFAQSDKARNMAGEAMIAASGMLASSAVSGQGSIASASAGLVATLTARAALTAGGQYKTAIDKLRTQEEFINASIKKKAKMLADAAKQINLSGNADALTGDLAGFAIGNAATAAKGLIASATGIPGITQLPIDAVVSTILPGKVVEARRSFLARAEQSEPKRETLFEKVKNKLRPEQINAERMQANYSTFRDTYAKNTGGSAIGSLAPRIEIAESELKKVGADALYDIDRNVVMISKALAKTLSLPAKELAKVHQKLKPLTHELQHSNQFAGGTLSLSEAAEGKGSKLQSANRLTRTEREAVNKSVAIATLENPKASSSALRKLEVDAYAAESRTQETIAAMLAEPNSKTVRQEETIKKQTLLGALRSKAQESKRAKTEQNFEAIHKEIAKTNNLKPSDTRTPSIAVSQDKSERYDAESNTVFVSPKTYATLAKSRTVLHRQSEALKPVVRMIQQSQQTLGGSLSPEDASRSSAFKLNSGENISRLQRTEIARNIERSVYRNPSTNIEQLQRLENDAYAKENESRSILLNAGKTKEAKKETLPNRIKTTLQTASNDMLIADVSRLQKHLSSVMPDVSMERLQMETSGNTKGATRIEKAQRTFEATSEKATQVIKKEDRSQADIARLQSYRTTLMSLYSSLDREPPNGFMNGLSRLGGGVSENIKNIKLLGAALATLPFAGGALMFLNRMASASLEAAISAARVKTSLEFSTGSSASGSKAYAYADERSTALGIDRKSSIEGYAKLRASSKGKLSEGQSNQLFEGVASASTTLGLSADDQNGVFLALGQVMSKGSVQAEELRGQIGERLPGAFAIAARAMDMTEAQLGKAMETGSVSAEQFIPKFGAQMKQEFGPGADKASQNIQSSMFRMQGSLSRVSESAGEKAAPGVKLFVDVATGGFNLIEKHGATLSNLLSATMVTALARLGSMAGSVIGPMITSFAAYNGIALTLPGVIGAVGSSLAGLLPAVAPFIAKFLLINAAIEIGKTLFQAFTPDDMGSRFESQANKIKQSLKEIEEKGKGAKKSSNLETPSKGIDLNAVTFGLSGQAGINTSDDVMKKMKNEKGESILDNGIVRAGLAFVLPPIGIPLEIARSVNEANGGTGLATWGEFFENNASIKSGEQGSEVNNIRGQVEESRKGFIKDAAKAKEYQDTIDAKQAEKARLLSTGAPDRNKVKQLDEEIKQAADQRDASGAGFAAQKNLVNESIVGIQAQKEELKKNKDYSPQKIKELTEQLDVQLAGLEKSKSQLDAIDKKFGGSADIMGKFNVALSEMAAKIEEASAKAKNAFNKSEVERLETKQAGRSTDEYASQNTAVKQAENEQIRAQSEYQGTKSTIGDIDKIMSDPTVKTEIGKLAINGKSIDGETSAQQLEQAKVGRSDKEKAQIDKLITRRKAIDNLPELKKQELEAEEKTFTAKSALEMEKVDRKTKVRDVENKEMESAAQSKFAKQQLGSKVNERDVPVRQAEIGKIAADLGVSSVKGQIKDVDNLFKQGKISKEEYTRKSIDLRGQLADATTKAAQAELAVEQAKNKRILDLWEENIKKRQVGRKEREGSATIGLIKGQMGGKMNESDVAIQKAELQGVSAKGDVAEIQKQMGEVDALRAKGVITEQEHTKRKLDMRSQLVDANIKAAEAELAIEQAKNRKILADWERTIKKRELGNKRTDTAATLGLIADQRGNRLGEDDVNVRKAEIQGVSSKANLSNLQAQLSELDSLRSRGVLTEEEHAKRRMDIESSILDAKVKAAEAELAIEQAKNRKIINGIDKVKQAKLFLLDQNQGYADTDAKYSQLNGQIIGKGGESGARKRAIDTAKQRIVIADDAVNKDYQLFNNGTLSEKEFTDRTQSGESTLRSEEEKLVNLLIQERQGLYQEEHDAFARANNGIIRGLETRKTRASLEGQLDSSKQGYVESAIGLSRAQADNAVARIETSKPASKSRDEEVANVRLQSLQAIQAAEMVILGLKEKQQEAALKQAEIEAQIAYGKQRIAVSDSERKLKDAVLTGDKNTIDNASAEVSTQREILGLEGEKLSTIGMQGALARAKMGIDRQTATTTMGTELIRAQGAARQGGGIQQNQVIGGGSFGNVGGGNFGVDLSALSRIGPHNAIKPITIDPVISRVDPATASVDRAVDRSAPVMLDDTNIVGAINKLGEKLQRLAPQRERPQEKPQPQPGYSDYLEADTASAFMRG